MPLILCFDVFSRYLRMNNSHHPSRHVLLLPTPSTNYLLMSVSFAEHSILYEQNIDLHVSLYAFMFVRRSMYESVWMYVCVLAWVLVCPYDMQAVKENHLSSALHTPDGPTIMLDTAHSPSMSRAVYCKYDKTI